jgi:biopolymer transport protein ExbD
LTFSFRLIAMPLKTQIDEVPALNLTSMIDVLFLLIIFFMVATKFDEAERNIDVNVPQVANAGDTSEVPQTLVVNVQQDGRLELDGATISRDGLIEKLAIARATRGDPSVVIRGDALCPFQFVADALAACRQANISELGITVRLAGVGAAGSVR